MELRLALNPPYSCLNLLSARIIGLCHCVWQKNKFLIIEMPQYKRGNERDHDPS
jgi:hypothetical protein